nr:immunoglobulin light chain junction region [Macaca mulatta]MOX35001.1 immunoglobulin light chain junction region [Macaca mulatta]
DYYCYSTDTTGNSFF